MRDKLLSVLLLFVSLIICFIVGEVAIRFIRPADIFRPKRSLMFTHQTFQLDSKNAVRYMPNNDIRTVAVYNGKIEYDVQFHTNNLGFIDNAEYNKSRTKENKKFSLQFFLFPCIFCWRPRFFFVICWSCYPLPSEKVLSPKPI